MWQDEEKGPKNKSGSEIDLSTIDNGELESDICDT